MSDNYIADLAMTDPELRQAILEQLQYEIDRENQSCQACKIVK